MNSPTRNRMRVALGTAVPSGGMKKSDGVMIGVSAAIIPIWPCKKNHPHYRIGFRKKPEMGGGFQLYCKECALERKHNDRRN